MSCEALGGVASRCVLARSTVLAHFEYPYISGGPVVDTVNGVGVNCSQGSCGRIEQNTISGAGSYLSSPSAYHALIGTGVSIDTAALWVARNDIVGIEFSGVCVNQGEGIDNSSGAGRFENNVIVGARGAAGCVLSPPTAIGYMGTAGPADVNSNYIQGSTSGCGDAVVGADGNVFRNNMLATAGCGYPFYGSSGVFEHNVLTPSTSSGVYVGYNTLDAAAAIDAQTSTHADGTIIGTCAMTSDYHLSAGSICIDAGTPSGAPPRDKDGDPRDALPDIGPDEYVP